MTYQDFVSPLWKCGLNPKVEDFFPQVNLDGITGEVKFDENGRRRGIQLEILNLRNNSFKKVILYLGLISLTLISKV